MAVMTLSGDNLRALRPLVLDALDYRQWRGVLADLIDAVNPTLAHRLQLLPTYELALRALDCGRYYERVTASTCRGLVLRYEQAVRKTRVRNLCNSGVHEPFRQSMDVGTAEWCGLPACGCGDYLGHRLTASRCWCIRRAHCLSLVWRGLDGQAVPPDVESGLVALRQSIRSTVAQSTR